MAMILLFIFILGFIGVVAGVVVFIVSSRLSNKQQIAQVRHCSSCGAILNTNSKYCGNCGQAIE